MRRCTQFAVIALFGSFLPVAARGSTITVSPTSSVTSLTMALLIADPGDTILLKTGVYNESVLIPGNLDDLTIIGVGKPILDARTITGVPLGGAIVIAADNVSISNLTIRNAAESAGDEGDGIRSTGLATVVNKCRILGNENAGIHLGGTSAVITNCVFAGNAFGVVLNAANSTAITKCTFRRSHLEAVSISGATDTSIDKCTFDEAGFPGAIDADEALVNTTLSVKGSKFRCVDGTALLFKGSGLAVENCSFTDVSGSGIVTNNATTVAITKCGFASIVGGSAIACTGGSGITILKCTAQDVGGSGVALSNAGSVLIASSSFKRGGRLFGAGILADQVTPLDLSKTTVSDFGEGFTVTNSSAVTMDTCIAKDCDRDGFDIDVATTSADLVKCTATGCLAEGLDNSGPATVAINCKFTGNRIDVANDGTLTLTGCTFTTGGITTAPAID